MLPSSEAFTEFSLDRNPSPMVVKLSETWAPALAVKLEEPSDVRHMLAILAKSELAKILREPQRFELGIFQLDLAAGLCDPRADLVMLPVHEFNREITIGYESPDGGRRSVTTGGESSFPILVPEHELLAFSNRGQSRLRNAFLRPEFLDSAVQVGLDPGLRGAFRNSMFKHGIRNIYDGYNYYTPWDALPASGRKSFSQALLQESLSDIRHLYTQINPMKLLAHRLGKGSDRIRTTPEVATDLMHAMDPVWKTLVDTASFLESFAADESGHAARMRHRHDNVVAVTDALFVLSDRSIDIPAGAPREIYKMRELYWKFKHDIPTHEVSSSGGGFVFKVSREQGPIADDRINLSDPSESDYLAICTARNIINVRMVQEFPNIPDSVGFLHRHYRKW